MPASQTINTTNPATPSAAQRPAPDLREALMRALCLDGETRAEVLESALRNAVGELNALVNDDLSEPLYCALTGIAARLNAATEAANLSAAVES